MGQTPATSLATAVANFRCPNFPLTLLTGLPAGQHDSIRAARFNYYRNRLIDANNLLTETRSKR